LNIDTLGAAEAAAQLKSCCGASRWVSRMVSARPFGTPERAKQLADALWGELSPADWREAFDHHPRIGGEKAAVPQDAAGAAWSSQEQSAVAAAGADVRAELARVNQEYERRFGYIYIVCATGKSAAELLAIARARLRNEPDAELNVAAEEQRKIMQLRLSKLLESP
jgi:2-oxo-4-hydroxy-4-carboxy-5-ureidoimidazoline decarboxylase